MEKKESASLVEIIMKVDWKAVIALLAALLSAYAQYKTENVHSSLSWAEHRMEADKKGRKAVFKEISKRLKSLETKTCWMVDPENCDENTSYNKD